MSEDIFCSIICFSADAIYTSTFMNYLYLNTYVARQVWTHLIFLLLFLDQVASYDKVNRTMASRD